MKFINRNIKKIIILIIIIVMTSGISVFATYKYFANEVKYTNDKSVAQALDELYANKNNTEELNALKSLLSKTNATEADIVNGKVAYSNGNLINGKLNLEKIGHW